MLYCAFIYFIVSVIAGLYGFSGIVAGADGITKAFFFVFFVIALISFFAALCFAALWNHER